MFNIKIKKTSLIVANKEPLASGASKIYHVSFDFDEEWDGLLKNVIFKAGEISVAVLLEGNSCQIPWEVLSSENIGEKLWIGVYGSDTEGTKLPTIWNELEVIQAGAELCGSGSEPTPTAVSLIYDVAKNAEKTAKDAIDEASKTGLYSDMAEKSKEAAEAAAAEAQKALGEAEVYVSQTSSLTAEAGSHAAEAERQKDEARSAVNEAMDFARFTDEKAASAAESAEIAKANTADIKKQCANALRGKLSGAIVRADDVSPIEHELDIKLTGETVGGTTVKRFGKNLFENDVEKLEQITYYSEQNGAEITVWGYMLNLPAGTYSAQSVIKPGVADHSRFIYIRKILVDGSAGNVMYLTTGLSATNTKRTFKILEGEKAFIYDATTAGQSQTSGMNIATKNFSQENVQIELGGAATDFEPYQSIEAVADEDGNVTGLMSLAPSMTLITDNESAVIECTYNRDTNKVIEELTNAIISLGGNI